MSIHDIITAVLAGIAALAGFIIEWRRIGNDAARVAELSVHVNSLEARLSIVEARHDRMDRAR